MTPSLSALRGLRAAPSVLILNRDPMASIVYRMAVEVCRNGTAVLSALSKMEKVGILYVKMTCLSSNRSTFVMSYVNGCVHRQLSEFRDCR
jgi:hypothetical protein